MARKPSKQRRASYNAPLHKRQKKVRARLSEKLAEKYNKRSIAVRKGDTVRIMRGDFKGHDGKVNRVSLKKCRIFVDGVTTKKADGSESFYPVYPSNAMIIKLETKDERRFKER